jgi:hypothetical protein
MEYCQALSLAKTIKTRDLCSMAKASGKENVIQGAITDALAVYCATQEINLRQFPPYANQQGAGLRKYCADIVGMLGEAQILLLEIKEHDCELNFLPAFDEEQHQDNIWFQNAGVPIAYAYNAVAQLEYSKTNRASNWPQVTLSQLNRAQPRELPGQSPSLGEHETLLDWLENARSEDVSEEFGRILGAAAASPENLRNGVLVLLHGVSERSLTALTPKQMKDVLGCLQNNSQLGPNHQTRLTRILGAEADIFNQWQTSSREADASDSFSPGF